MSYLPLDEYQRKWIFTHQSMPVPEEDLAFIKPMSQARSAQFWKENISAQSPDMDRLSSQDWPMSESNWLESVDWMAAWESDEPEMPQEVNAHIDWQDDVTVYFCYEKYNVIETKWSIFKKHWKNFCSMMMVLFLLVVAARKHCGLTQKEWLNLVSVTNLY